MRSAALVLTCILASLVHAFDYEWTWQTNLGIEPIVALAALDETNVWVAAADVFGAGAIYHFDGSSWSQQFVAFDKVSATGTLRGAYAVDAHHVWFVGDTEPPVYGRVYFFDGVSWVLQTNMIDSSYLQNVFSADGTAAWIAANLGNIWQTTNGGVEWLIATNIPANMWFAIDGTDNEHLWVAGGQQPSRVMYYDGVTWDANAFTTDLGGFAYLRGIAVVATNDVWVAGTTNGTIVHYTPSGWAVVTNLGPCTDFTPICALDDSNVWTAIGGDMTTRGIYYCDGAEWVLQTNLSVDVTALDAAKPFDVWAGTKYGGILRLTLIPEPCIGSIIMCLSIAAAAHVRRTF